MSNLEPSYMSGSHWIATYVKDNVINYFGSFGMPPCQEIVDHTDEKNLTLLHQDQQIQNLYTSTSGYFCLYLLNEQVPIISIYYRYFLTIPLKNKKFIADYFKKHVNIWVKISFILIISHLN